MREIKFRAYNTYINEYDSFNIQTSGSFPFFLTSDRHIVEQYTGLKDNKGVEIYEGDKVRWREDEDDGWTYDVVVWGNSYPAFDLRENSYEYNILSSPEIEFEVIGNIHE